MKNFLVNIWAYDHHARFNVFAEDNAESVEQSILDKIGENSINWEYLGNNYNNEENRITLRRLLMIQDLYKQKRSLELKWEQEHINEGKYTLNMVRLDDKIRQVITEIKLEEAEIAHRKNSVEGAAPQVSVAT